MTVSYTHLDVYKRQEEPWTLKHNSYASEAEGNPVDIACEIYREIKLP